eukprot:Gb_19219 [translate_table: standard]
MSDFLAYALNIKNLYSQGKLPNIPVLDAAKDLIQEMVRTDGETLLKYLADEFAWRKDEEFAREMVSCVNPVVIQHLQNFPPRSKLDELFYGPQISCITAGHVEINLDGLTLNQAMDENKLFILDHYDAFMLYLNRINALPSRSTYATRTILFLKNDGTLKPVAIELCLPRSVRKVFMSPEHQGAPGALWQLAKTYVAVHDSGYHQLVSHWLKSHAVTEPFIITTNRQLSVMHPVYKLLYPHFGDTVKINAMGYRKNGLTWKVVFMEMTAYKNWRFDE